MKNVLSFDIEEWFQSSNLQKIFIRDEWHNYESRVTIGVDKILDILSKRSVKATFFVSGWLAENRPGIVNQIDKAGHEIASHGYEHGLIYEQTPDIFRADLKKSIDILNKLTGKNISGFRAPNYSITKKSLWALDVLKSEGIEYDSSIYPARRFTRGGMVSKNLKPYFIKEGLLEFPLSVISIFSYHVPVASGAFFRLYPYGVTRWAINRLNRAGIPAVVNIHPWELDSEQPVQKINVLYKASHYTNLRKTEERLGRLLVDFDFTTMREKYLDFNVK